MRIVMSKKVCTDLELRSERVRHDGAGMIGVERKTFVSGWGAKSSILIGGLCLLTLLLAPAAAIAESDSKAAAAGENEPPPISVRRSDQARNARDGDGQDPGLDRLLQLPSGFLQPNARTVAGAGETEWERRFTVAQKGLESAVETLAMTKSELDSIADEGGSSQWAVAPPGSSAGSGPTNSPLSFKLRQDLLRHRDELDAAEKAVKELRIEADLAGVPVGWRSGDLNTPIPRRIPEDPRYK
jgi:hypothetical protein